MASWNLQVQGMTCTSCAKNIENRVRTVPGVKQVSVDVLLEQVAVVGDCQINKVVLAIESAGFCVVSSNLVNDISEIQEKRSGTSSCTEESCIQRVGRTEKAEPYIPDVEAKKTLCAGTVRTGSSNFASADSRVPSVSMGLKFFDLETAKKL
eukprot:jgi/Galph1/1230/GphlegSOOS_G6016.1